MREANDYLILISPYIQFHDRMKSALRQKQALDKLGITVVFGKNEDNKRKSISAEDLAFLQEFPNIRICYEKNLHAKFYASDDLCLITSMNLHRFSQNNNVEAGILLRSKLSAVKVLTDLVVSATDAGDQALQYFEGVIKQSEVVFQKEPQYDKHMLGLSRSYKGSVITVDKTATFFTDTKPVLDQIPVPTAAGFARHRQQAQSVGYCIRTGLTIPFNPDRPLSDDAYRTWRQFSNPDYPERFCHYSGEPSHGETSVGRPILRKNWSKSRV